MLALQGNSGFPLMSKLKDVLLNPSSPKKTESFHPYLDHIYASMQTTVHKSQECLAGKIYYLIMYSKYIRQK